MDEGSPTIQSSQICRQARRTRKYFLSVSCRVEKRQRPHNPPLISAKSRAILGKSPRGKCTNVLVQTQLGSTTRAAKNAALSFVSITANGRREPRFVNYGYDSIYRFGREAHIFRSCEIILPA